MPFDHAVTLPWGRWLRSVIASRPPSTQVVGQQIEDSLRAVIIAGDVRNMTAPINWAQAGCRRFIGAGGAGTVARVELNSLAAGGLWVEKIEVTGFESAFLSLADAPALVGNQTGFADFGQVPTVSTVGAGVVVEAAPSADQPNIPAQSLGLNTIVMGLFVPPGRTLRMICASQTANLTINSLFWREIPAVQTP